MSFKEAVAALETGRLIAYPTEAVFGVGCDPRQPDAVKSLYALKKRSPRKGVILIAHSFDVLFPFLDLSRLSSERLKAVQATWPGPHTWIFPAHPCASGLTGETDSLAVRVTAHPIARDLCKAFNAPIVSTSANPEGLPPAKTAKAALDYFPNDSLTVVSGEVGDLQALTVIQDAFTLQYIRR